jgi:hypothetical protein
MGYRKKQINIIYHEIFKLSDAELNLPKILSPTARAFQLKKIMFPTSLNICTREYLTVHSSHECNVNTPPGFTWTTV